VLACVQAIEVRSAIGAEQHSFTVNHKRALAISQRGLDNEGIAVAPVVPVAGEVKSRTRLPYLRENGRLVKVIPKNWYPAAFPI
jgi:hypothetical protein